MSNTPTTTIKTTDVDHGNESEAATSTTPDPLQNSSNSLQTTQNTSNKSFPRESGGTKRKKWMLILIVLIVMSTLAFAGYFFHQNQQPKGQAELIETAVVLEETLQADPTTSDVTEGWEVYQDLEIGFMIKHPEDLKVLMLSQTTEASVEKMFVFENQNKEIIGTLSIDKLNYMYSMRRGENLPQTKILTLDEYMQQNANGDVVNGDLGQCRPSNVGLLQGFLCTTNPYSTEAYIFITKNNQRFIQFSGALKDQVLLDQILSTFEFGDAANEVSSSTQSTTCVYENDDYQFSLTHPCFDTGGMIGLGTIQENFEQLITLHPDTLGGGTDEKFDGLSVYAKRFNNSQELTSSLQALIDEFIPEKNPDNNATNPVKQTFEQNEQIIVRIENLQFGLRLYALDLQNTNSLIVFFVSEKTAGSFIEEAEKIIFSTSMK